MDFDGIVIWWLGGIDLFVVFFWVVGRGVFDGWIGVGDDWEFG